ncbi:Cyclin-G-associated kinase [Paragonimus heterotremus]|uniref:Cyclin-G-associated kinase n=1 Tax=Paragonimus heterotremus TaxID=100268 RepID=A0A8J4TNR4_9TREM|nr:Cyclin-G-associated kinase [Paragonimus heterotremus]
MADYLRSAFSYLASSSASKPENEFVGSTICVGTLTLRVKRAIAEGGFGVVYEAQDVSKGTSYALKKQLSGHPNIMRFFHAASVGREKVKSSGTEFLIVTELCKGGQLSQYLPTPRQERPFSVHVILQIMHQTCRAVQHMHNQFPPVIHRDLKIENLLLSEDYVIKLCDFGSATTTCYLPDPLWSALKRMSVQEEIEKFTTPMYRAPEMLDLYQNHPIGTASDVWALGCILFCLTCTYHPFEDSAKLAILNANYNLPTDSASSEHTIFHGLIRQMLLIDPRQRPNITEVLGELSELASMRELRVNGSIPIMTEVNKRRGVNPTAAPANTVILNVDQSSPAGHDLTANDSKVNTNRRTDVNPKLNRPPSQPSIPSRPPAPNPVSSPSNPSSGPNQSPSLSSPNLVGAQRAAPQPTITSSSGANTSNVFGILKGGAGNLLRNLRDASNKVLESVSSTLTSDLDFVLITSRIAVMSYPAESGFEAIGTSNSMEEVQNMLNSRYPNAYAVYNLSPRPYRSDRCFDGRVSHRVFDSHQAPTLRSLVELCMNARLWLQRKPENICVVHCTDGRALSAVFICSLLCFCHVFDNVSPALQLFSSRRGNPRLNASQIRYIDYVAQLAHNRVRMPHHRPLQLISLTVAPIPTFNNSKTGCRPYVEVYEGKKQVCSTFAEYENLRSYVLEDGKIEFMFNGVSVMGDLTVIVYHCRSSFAGRGKVASVKIAQFQLYTGFVDTDQTELMYFKSDLDHLDKSSGFSGFTSRYAESFHLTLEFMVSPNERPRQGNNLVYPWEMLPPADSLQPELCVSDAAELQSLLSDFGRFNLNSTVPKKVPSANGVSVDLVTDAVPSVDLRERVLSEPDFDKSPVDDSHTSDPASSGPREPYETDDKVTTPVADLLGFTANTHELHSSDHPSTQPTSSVLIDVDSVLSDEPLASDSHTPKQTAFVDDLFGLHTHPESSSTDWTASFNLNSELPHSQSTSNNPFDPFSIPTGHPDPNLSSTFDPVDTNRPVVGEDAGIDFDVLFGHGHMSTSASASNLSATKSMPPYPSASFTSLASNDQQSTKSNRPDPFADLSGLFVHKNGGTCDDTVSEAASVRRTQRDIHDTNSVPRPNSTYGCPQASWSTFSTASGGGPVPGEPSANASTNASAPSTASPNRTGARPHVRPDAFSDLLGDFGGSSAYTDNLNQPRTVNQMRREQLAKTTDPDQLRVEDWAHGKDRNLRALLCSLPAILWDGVRWKPVGITDLLTPEQVKRQYRNAARAVHPDRWLNTENEKLARMIFVELNDARIEFEKECEATPSF